MASRKLVRDLLITTKQPIFQQLTYQRRVGARLGLFSEYGYVGHRRFSVFSEFSKKFKGEVDSNPEFQKTVNELKGVKEDLKVRTKETTEKLYNQVDGVWTEAESVAKKVSSSVKDKFTAATEEAKESFKFGKEENAESASSSGTGTSEGEKQQQQQQQQQQSGTREEQDTFFGKFKSSISSPMVSQAFDMPLNFAKKGLDIVKEELRGSSSKKKHLEYTPPPPFTGERSTRTELVVTPKKQSKWESFKEKMQGYPIFKRLSGMSEPVVNKSQEIAEDVMERWETSDSPLVHKIQDMNATVFLETDSATTYKEIRRRDPSFSLPEFAAEVQEAIKPVLDAYSKGDAEILKKFCSKEVIERCLAENSGYQSHGVFFDYKLLHISEVEVKETKMVENYPVIIVEFLTQQIYCARAKDGVILEGSQDTILGVYYRWAMQQVEAAELGEDAIHPIWRLRDIKKSGVQYLI